MRLDAIDLFYRPVYALRYRWQQKEAVVEVDAVTGETQTGGTTFETYVGKLVDRDFLLDAGLAWEASPLASYFRYAGATGEQSARQQLPQLLARLQQAGLAPPEPAQAAARP